MDTNYCIGFVGVGFLGEKVNIAIISENHDQLLMHFDMLYKNSPPDVYDSLEMYRKMNVKYDLVLVDHQVNGKRCNEIYQEGTRFIVLATNPLHWYKLEFPDTLGKDLDEMLDKRGVYFVEKWDEDNLKITIDLLSCFFTCKNLIKKLYY